MEAIRQLFRANPLPEPIRDQRTIEKEYPYWRIRIFYSMFIGYAFFYFTRKNFNFAIPCFATEMGCSPETIGWIMTVFSLMYGVSKFFSGILADRSNPRFLMAIGLMATGVINIAFGMSSSMLFFILLWSINGWFQGFGWPPCAKFLTHWYSHSERGRWWSFWNISHNLGGFLTAFLIGSISEWYGWRASMYIPGVLCIAGGFFLLNRLRDTPESLGLPDIETYRQDFSSTPKERSETLTTREVFLRYLIYNPAVWCLAAAYFFVYFVRMGVGEWSTLMLVQLRGYKQMEACWCSSAFELGGFAGSLAAGWCSDMLFSARRGPVNLLFALGTLLFVVLFAMVQQTTPWMDAAIIFGIGFMIFGPQMLIGVAVAELSHKKAAATATGFAGTFGYLGSAVAGYPLGKVLHLYGWQGVFWTFVASGVCAFFLLALVMVLSPEKKAGRAVEGASPVEA